jgi:ferric-dicitrate binding protein FerR (iron transport regulator)
MNEKNKKMNGNDTESKIERFRLFVGLLQRYFTGQASEKENQIIDVWDAQSAWEKHRKKVDNRKMDTACDEVWDKISTQLHFKKKHRIFQLSTYLSHYAAVAVIFILLGGSILYYTQHDFTQQKSGLVAQAKTLFQTTDAQTKSVVLPDGSRIQMNRGTKFSYATHAFNRRQREVWLEGEAFFEVAKNKEKPFIIHTGTMTTTVRGTSFNVKAYPQLAENVVSVRTGKVEVSNHDQMLAVLVKNKQLAYNRLTNKVETSDAAWEDAAGWREGELMLNYANRDELKLKLKQYYQVDIQFRDNALNGIKIKSTFLKSTSLSDVLSTIKALYGIQYSTNGNQVIIHN